MLELIKGPWHWAISGSLIGLTVPALLLLGNKKFGVSSSLRHICAMCVPANIPFFKYGWRKELWNLFFVLGIAIGAFIAVQLLSNPNDIAISDATKLNMQAYGLSDLSGLMPIEVFNSNNIFTARGFVFFVVGGLLVGFGTRYAAGCTSGHSIMGMANLQWPSLVATCCFMVGGFFSANILVPLIFKYL